jgi:hypothetical protein
VSGSAISVGNSALVIPLHDYAQTSYMWRPLIAELARTLTVTEARDQVVPKLASFFTS